MKQILVSGCFCLYCAFATAAELSGVYVEEQISAANGQTLLLNGVGLREKFWVDVYVGSLYLSEKSSNVEEILSQQGAWRIQLDFVYKEVTSKKLIKAWREGFEKNQSEQSPGQLQTRIDQFYRYFATNVVAKDQYSFDYIPGKGTTITKNQTLLGTIPGDDFKNALLKIWLGDYPASKALKRGMLGLN